MLGPDVDTSKLAANMSEDSLTSVNPKIEKKEALEKTESTKIEIKIGESNTAKLKDIVEDEITEYRKVPTPSYSSCYREYEEGGRTTFPYVRVPSTWFSHQPW